MAQSTATATATAARGPTPQKANAAPTLSPRPGRVAGRARPKAVANAAVAVSTPSDASIYERIVLAIRDHQLAPGTKLVEDKLGLAFGVSRTRIRPILVRLANEQVVTLTPNRGASVAEPSEIEAREVFEVRRLIEPRLVALFTQRASADHLRALKTCIEAEEVAREAGDMRRAIRLSGDFHLLIAEHAGHQTLGRVLRELVSRTSLVLMSYSADHAQARQDATACGCREHRALLDAISLRDASEAAKRMVDHLTQLESQLAFDDTPAALPDFQALFASAPVARPAA